MSDDSSPPRARPADAPDLISSRQVGSGRFDEAVDALAARFSESVSFDRRLADDDIRGSIAHANMLAARGIVDADDRDRIVAGLAQIRDEIAAGEMAWSVELEDVHMNIEARLTERIGEAGGRLHTGRSRNDQVATDMRLWTRGAIESTVAAIDALLTTIAERAGAHHDHVLPGYTHLQRAQPVRLSHHMMAWAQMLERDRGRLVDARRRLDECPLGSAALAGTTFALDREMTARELGFSRPTENSLDAVADRDFVMESLSALAICAVHLSRIAEELVLWSSQEFAFVQMSDAFTTGSSIMPQKKNPDMAELVRGKTGRVVGHLVNVLMLMKALPLAYNRDMQEDKPPTFDAFDTVTDSLAVLRGCLAEARFDRGAMRAALRDGFVDATELADHLASRGVPFRDAHHVAGRCVRRALAANKTLSELTVEELRDEHPALDEAVFNALDPEVAIERRGLYGGPARARVQAQIDGLRERLDQRRERGWD